MSNRRKNNHYHYAEKFEDRCRRSARGKRAYMPFKSVVISLVVLLMFGFITTTFATYVSEDEPAADMEYSPIISEVRNLKASRDVALTGANADLAATGWTCSGYYPIFDNTNTGWSGTIHAAIGNGNGFAPYALTQIDNTKLYGVSSGISFTDNPYKAFFFSAASSWSEFNSTGSDNYSSKYQYMTNYTAVKTFTSNVGGMWYANGAGTAKGTSLTWAYDSNGYSHYNYEQKIQSYTSTDGTNYYANTNGGTISVTSAYKLDGNASSTSSTPSNGTFDAAKTSSVTLSASANSGYRFVGWYNSSNTQIGTSSTYTYTVTGANEVRARFIKRVKISTAKNPTAYTGSPAASPATEVDVGTAVTLTADVKTGVTFNGWSTSSGASYTTSTGSINSTTWKIIPTSSFTATASYTLQQPTGLSLSYPTVVAGNTSTPTKTATSPAGTNGTLSYSFTKIEPQTGTTAAADTYSVNASTGVVTASTPGKYTVTMSVTNTAYGLTSAASTVTATVTVKPVAPTCISYEASNADSGAGTYEAPYKTPVDRTKFNIKSYIPVEDRVEGYTYNWTRTDGTYLIASGAITVGSHSVKTESTNEVTDTASACALTTDVIHNTVLADSQGYIYKIAVTAVMNGVESDPYYYTFYYGVTADFLVVESFDFKQFNESDSIQKIYAEDNTIDHIDAAYDAGGKDTFNTMLWFSKDNLNFDKTAVWTKNGFTIGNGNVFAGTYTAFPDDAAHKTSSLITEISVKIKEVYLMQQTGPKWFKGYVDDYNNAKIAAQYPELHTTVGTSSTVANRPVYYVDNTGKTHENSRVMAFYRVASDDNVHYQTAQKFSGRDNTYRFYIPSDATQITFAHVAENSYVLPTYSDGTFSYAIYTDSKVLMAWTSTVDLTAEENIGMNTFTTSNAPGTADSNGIYNYTGTMGTLG